MRSPPARQRTCPPARLRRRLPVALALALALVLPGHAAWSRPPPTAPLTLHTYPGGPIYDYRWKVLELALAHTRANERDTRLEPYPEDVTQDRGQQLLEAGAIDVIALGTNASREAHMLPIRIDILRGMVGYRLLVIRASDQARIAAMSDRDMRERLSYGLNTQWADLPVMRAAGYTVETTTSYENLFSMLADRRFDAFPRGLNEARIELDARRARYPGLAVEQTRALYFPFPIYFWVNRANVALARRIDRGMRLALADGSMREMFQRYYATEIAMMKKDRRHVIRLDNPTLPSGTPAVDTSWWWQ